MFDSLFAFLFKYRPVVFQRGDLVLGASWSWALTALVLLAIGAVWTYRGVRRRARPLDRVVLATLRLAALAVLVLALLRPALAVSALLPQQNFLAVLVDDSRSMRVADEDGKPRGDAVRTAFGDDAALTAALGRRFRLRYFRFSSSAERVAGVDSLAYDGTQTRIGPALRRARQELAGVPLAGLVVVSDGADNSGESLTEPLLALRSAGVPVYAVGVGRPRLARDVELSRVAVPPSVLQGTSLVVDLVVTQRGFGGERAPLYVEDEGHIVAEQQIELPADGESTPVRVRFTLAEPGVRHVRFRVPARDGEAVTRNNEQEALIRVESKRRKILYFEGEPRFELKFLRRAVEDEAELQLVTLVRTAPGKFLRLGVDGPDELVGGFPKTREELFAYDGVVLGSVEASFFTHDQLRMIADFAGERGGGLLTLGGRHAFARGGYAGTPLAEALPVVLDPGDGAPQDSFVRVHVAPTRAGRVHAVTQIAADEAASVARWDSLPAVTTPNPMRRVKPGATTLLAGEPDGHGDGVVALAWQRYGRGRSVSFPIQDSWVWQMDASIPVEDMTHETFWRQLLRWLVDAVPGQVAASVSRDHVEPGRALELRADVVDSAFLALDDAHVVAHVHGPGGDEDVPLDWDVDRDGAYRARYIPSRAGSYTVDVEARRGDVPLGSSETAFEAAPSEAEYFDAGMREPLLRRIARETGGRFYTTASLSTLPEDLRYTGGGVTAVEHRDLWDMPIVFLLLLGLVGAEWGWRRARGLA